MWRLHGIGLTPNMEQVNSNMEDAPGRSADDQERLLRGQVSAAIEAGGGIKKMTLKTGIPKGTLEKYAAETSTPSFLNAARIASATGLSLDVLAGGDPSVTGHRKRPLGQIIAALDEPRLERAIEIVERGLADAGREAIPAIKAGMISAAYEMLKEPSEATEGRILRLVKG